MSVKSALIVLTIAAGAATPAFAEQADTAGKVWAPGDYLPPSYLLQPFDEAHQYGLEEAPQGYIWVVKGDNAYLAEKGDGRVVDTLEDLLV